MIKSKRRATDLEARLVEWGKEYGGGKYEHESGGSSPLASLMKWHGRPPTGLGFVPVNTAADEVHAAVKALAQQTSGYAAANVIRCEYWMPAQPVQAKMQKLRAMGIPVSDRARYSQLLRDARIHVAGWLRIPVGSLRDDDTDEDFVDL